MDDQQESAPRPNDLTLDPKYRSFVPIPNTPVLIKFNTKPRVDFTDDPQNTGNPDRFVTAQIPVDGDFFQGGENRRPSPILIWRIRRWIKENSMNSLQRKRS
jgi:hypothetical protein